MTDQGHIERLEKILSDIAELDRGPDARGHPGSRSDDDWHQTDDPKRVAAPTYLLAWLQAIGCPNDLVAKGILRAMWGLHVMQR